MAMFMKRFESETYAVMRILSGLLFMVHGSSKLFDYPTPMPPDAPAFVVWGAGTIELIGGAFVAAGFMTRWAAFICSGTMAVAYWLGHGTKHLFPSVNGGELAVLYCFVFLFIASRGAGIWSVDGAHA